MEENNWNMSRNVTTRPKRSDSSRTGSHRNRTSRVNPVNVARSPTYIDDVTLNAMITSGMMEALGPVHFAQFRVPIRQASDHNQNDLGASQIDYRLGWIPKNLNLPTLPNPKEVKEDNFKFKAPDKDSIAEFLQDEEPPKKDPRFLLPKLIMEEGDLHNDIIQSKRQETIMEWFDRAVERELSKRKVDDSIQKISSVTDEVIGPAKNLNFPSKFFGKMSDAHSSHIESSDLPNSELDELTDAVDKLSKAEAMCAFAGAVQAAEEAAEAAPPELAEEAAQASAKIFQSEINTSEIRQEVQGTKPMEVIGYIGITKPKYPIRPQRK